MRESRLIGGVCRALVVFGAAVLGAGVAKARREPEAAGPADGDHRGQGRVDGGAVYFSDELNNCSGGLNNCSGGLNNCSGELNNRAT
jgi:hypothetical protein